MCINFSSECDRIPGSSHSILSRPVQFIITIAFLAVGLSLKKTDHLFPFPQYNIRRMYSNLYYLSCLLGSCSGMFPYVWGVFVICCSPPYINSKYITLRCTFCFIPEFLSTAAFHSHIVSGEMLIGLSDISCIAVNCGLEHS